MQYGHRHTEGAGFSGFGTVNPAVSLRHLSPMVPLTSQRVVGGVRKD